MLRTFTRTSRSLVRFHASALPSSMVLQGFNDSHVKLLFKDIHGSDTVSFSNFFLRDSDKLEASFEPNSRQKIFSTSDLPYDVKPAGEPKMITTADGLPALQITWSDGVESVYDQTFLRKFLRPDLIKKGKNLETEMELWDHNKFWANGEELVNTHTFKGYLENDEEYFKVLDDLNKFGIVYINGIPEGDNFIMPDGKWALDHIIARMGYLRETFYGRLFDVKTVPNAKNLAFTPKKLPFHSDLMYYEAPPGIQILHALQNLTVGGESLFCDAFYAAEQVKKADPEAYQALKDYPINFHKIGHDDQYFAITKHTIVEDLDGNIKEVNYSPANMAEFEYGITDADPKAAATFKNFLRGIKLLDAEVDKKLNQIAVKMKEGLAVLFNNRRVLHTRNPYKETKGETFRWLKGGYLDTDTFESQLRLLKTKYEPFSV